MRGGWSWWGAVAIAGALTGCGGGGGGGGGSGGDSGGTVGGAPVVVAPPPPNVVEAPRVGPANYAAEAARNYGLADIGALSAQAANQTGAGITVGVVDTGIDLNHSDFAGAISPASTNILTGAYADVQGVGNHGTLVAGIIGARKDGYDGLGVAPGSTILAVRADTPGTCPSACTFNDSAVAAAVTYAAANGAKIINLSLGGTTSADSVKAALAAATAGGVIVAAAAGNSGASLPIDPARTIAGAGGNGLGIAVGAVDATNTIALFSNQAGATASHFLVAPGVNITGTGLGGGVVTGTGTSFAAPQVSGAAAVVWGASPFLTGLQVVNILLTSATDLGAPGIDPVYGAGLVNLQAALQPLGQVVVPTGATVAAGGATVASTQISAGAAFGNGLSRTASALSSAVVFDSYGRPFHTDLSGAVTAAPSADHSGWIRAGGPVSTLQSGPTRLTLIAPEAQLDQEVRPDPGHPAAPPRFSLTSDLGGGASVAMAGGMGLGHLSGLAATAPEAASTGILGNTLDSPFLALAGDGSAVAASQTIGDGLALTLGFGQGSPIGTAPALPGLPPPPDSHAVLAEATRRWRDGSALGVQAGQLSEQGGPLASSGGGAFAFGRPADTLFLGLFGATPIQAGSTLFGRFGWGSTSGAALGDVLLRDASAIHSQSFAVGTTAADAITPGDRMTFTLSQPLKVVSGDATLAVPVGRTMDGTVLTQTSRVGLTPTGTETDLELGWTTRWGGGNLTLGGALMLDPGHVASAGPGAALGGKYRIAW